MGGQQQRPEIEQQNAGYRGQRIAGVFGDPVIANLMNSLRGLMGGPNVPGQMFQGGGFAPGQSPGGGSPVMADPAAAALLELLRGQNPSLARESQVPNTGTAPVVEPVPTGAPPNTGTVPAENLPNMGAPAQPAVPAWLVAMLEHGGPNLNMGGPQGPSASPNFEAGGPGAPNVA